MNGLEDFTETGKRRIEWLDVAKAIGIFLIVLGHCPIPNGVYKILYSFHVPLFFFLSAVVLNYDRQFRLILTTRFQKIMLPYFFAAVPSILVYQVMGRYASASLGSSANSEQFNILYNILGMLMEILQMVT